MTRRAWRALLAALLPALLLAGLCARGGRPGDRIRSVAAEALPAGGPVQRTDTVSEAAYLPVVMRTWRSGAPEIDGCRVFPVDHIWNTPIDTLPVHANSTAFINTIGHDTGLHPDFGSGTWQGSPIGIPFTTVLGTQTPVTITFGYADESDPGPYPIPPDAPIEGGPGSTGDRHVLVVDRGSCILYEMFYAWPQPDGSWYAGSGAVFDLDSYSLRPETWTSADAAGLPILPGLVRYDEVAAGGIHHAMRFTAAETRRELQTHTDAYRAVEGSLSE